MLAIPVIAGRKTVRERFAGATSTYTLEAMMGDGKALQMGTSHELGQNFAKAFDITYTTAGRLRRATLHDSLGDFDPDGRRPDHVLMATTTACASRRSWRRSRRTSWSSRTATACWPPPGSYATTLRDAGVRVGFDDRVDTPFGRRAVDAELKGYPVRIEVGPRDLADGNVTIARRVHRRRRRRSAARCVRPRCVAALDEDQKSLYDEALAYRRGRTVDVDTVDEAIEAATGWVRRVPWAAVGLDGEAKANASAVTVRCLVRPDGGVPDSDDEPGMIAVMARSY